MSIHRRSFSDLATGDVATCEVAECERPAARAGRCWGHLKQRQRGEDARPLREYGQSLRAKRVRLALALSDADDDDEFERLLDLLRKCRRATKR